MHARLSIKNKLKKGAKKGYAGYRGARGNRFAWMTTAAIVQAGEKSIGLLFHNVAEGILLDSKRIKSIPAGSAALLVTD